ncbi:MAG: hypothetical protein JO056_11590 [Alphaproteobacteria bacterium]|nr:hypothetical protein [Alphaproteobacteria bacterium]
MQAVQDVVSASHRVAGVALALCLLPLVGIGAAEAWTYKTLYSFNGAKGGGGPGAIIRDSATGDFYGTTFYGGFKSKGVAFKVSADGKETVLHRFTGQQDGEVGLADDGLTRDDAGNLYGVAAQGGNLDYCFGYGCGVVFKIAPDGAYTVLHAFTDSDGSDPRGRLTWDATSGDLYGTTYAGGQGFGVVFKLTADGTYSVLYSFSGIEDGAYPGTGLTMDGSGYLYGTTPYGGDWQCRSYGCGTIFKLAPDGSETLLHVYHTKKYAPPHGDLIGDGMGHLYGTAGVNVFRIGLDGAYVIVHRFKDIDGHPYAPVGDLSLAASGGLFGMAVSEYSGLLFHIAANGKEKVLYNFPGEPWPRHGVIGDEKGNLYGVTFHGGSAGNGAIFELVKD